MTDESNDLDKAVKQAESEARATKTRARTKAAEQKAARKPDPWALDLLNSMDRRLGTEGDAWSAATVWHWLDLLRSAETPEYERMMAEEMPVMNRVVTHLFVGGYPVVRPCPQYEDAKAEHRFRYGCITRDRWIDIDTGPILIRPLEHLETALEIMQPSGSRMKLEQIGRDDWLAHYVSPEMNNADLTFEQHTRRGRHFTPALATSMIFLSGRHPRKRR